MFDPRIPTCPAQYYQNPSNANTMLSLAKLAALLFAGVNLAHAVALDRRANPAVSVGLDGNVRIIIANREENGQWVESNVHMEWSADTHYFINGLGQDPSVTSQRFTYEAYNQGELFRGQVRFPILRQRVYTHCVSVSLACTVEMRSPGVGRHSL